MFRRSAMAILAIVLLIGGIFLFRHGFSQVRKPAPAGPPIADFTATPASGQAPVEIAFDASSSTGQKLTYSWDFADGSKPVTGKKVKHIFLQPGQFDVKLTVANKAKQTAEKVGAVNISAPAVANLPPVAGFRFSQLGSSVRTMEFVSEATDPEGSLLVISWDFGDGTQKGGDRARVPHQYAAAGDFTVTQTVIDDKGASAFLSQKVTVTDTTTPPPTPPTGDPLEPFRDGSVTPPADPLQQFR